MWGLLIRWCGENSVLWYEQRVVILLATFPVFRDSGLVAVNRVADIFTEKND